MGEQTLTQLVGEVQAALLNRSDLTNERCVIALNAAQNQISRSHDFQELKAWVTVSTSYTGNAFNDKFLSLPPYTKHVHVANLLTGTPSSRKLIEKPWRLFNRMWPQPEILARGYPMFYTQWNQSLVLYPVPQMLFNVNMWITTFPRPFTWAQAQAYSDFNWKDDILIDLAVEYLWRSYGRNDKADEYLVRSKAALITAVRQDTDRPDMDVSSDPSAFSLGPYWLDPFVRRVP